MADSTMTPKRGVSLYKVRRRYKHGDKIHPEHVEDFGADKLEVWDAEKDYLKKPEEKKPEDEQDEPADEV